MNPNHRIFLFFLILKLILSQDIYCQHIDEFQFNIYNYSLEEGLPSNECHAVFQDSIGYIWIATDRGLTRFDGYGFKNYGVKQGLQNISCLKLQLDQNNNIWILTYGHQIYKYINALDTIVSYEYNKVIEHYKNQSDLQEFHVTKEGILYCNLLGIGVLRINKHGKAALIDNPCKISKNLFEIEGSSFLTSQPSLSGEDSGQFCFRSKIFINDKIEFHHSYIFRINNDTSLICNTLNRFFIELDSIKSLQPTLQFRDLIQYKGAYLSAELYERGVKLYRDYVDLKDNKFQQILPNVSATCLFEDRQSNLFISTLNNGVYFLKRNQNVKSISTGNPVNAIETVSDSLLYFIENNNAIFSIHPESLDKKLLQKGKRYFDIGSFKEKNIISMSHPYSELMKDGIWEKLYSIDKIDFIGKKIVNLDEEYWLIGPGEFQLYNLANEETLFTSSSLQNRFKILSISKYKGDKYLLTGVDGLFEFDLSNKKSLQHLHPAFSQRINDVIEYKGFYFFATLGSGIIIWDGESYFDEIDLEDGLVTNNIEKLILKNNQLFACSYSGFSTIDFKEKDHFGITNYNRQNGLPSDQIFDIDVWGDALFVGTRKGLVRIDKKPSSSRPYQTIIERVEINNKPFKKTRLEVLDHNQNNITIKYKALDLKFQGEIIYQFRLLDKWTTSKETSVNFANLSPGEYSFEVKASNNSGAWGDPTYLVIKISPPWWKTKLFYVLFFFTLLAISYFFVKRSILNIKYRASIKEEMKNLQRSALQSQMNPHFIFNSLNSIQNFIMNNNKEEAMEYLSQFAQLIRGTLDASTKSQISLESEIKNLENYLSLENLRLNGQFEYNIKSDSNIDLQMTKIPPMLIQPIVENSVIHGMKAKKEGGKIEVSFSKEDSRIIILVKDNGTYIEKNKNKEHESMGSNITRKRLALINNTSVDNVSVIPEVSALGSIVKIYIDLH